MMMKIFELRKKKLVLLQEQLELTKEQWKEAIPFSYFDAESDRFDFYLHVAGMELENKQMEPFYNIEQMDDEEYPFRLTYTVKKLEVSENSYYTVTLKLTKEELDKLDTAKAPEMMHYPIENIKVEEINKKSTYDFFTLPDEKIDEVGQDLFESYTMMAHYWYVPSEVDGEYGTSYKRIKNK